MNRQTLQNLEHLLCDESDDLLECPQTCANNTQAGKKNDRQLAGASDDKDNNDNEDDGSTGAAMHLRRDAPRQGPPFHGRLVLHILDLLLQCVLVHGGEYTGIHGYSRTPLVANREWDDVYRKINKNRLRVAIGGYARYER